VSACVYIRSRVYEYAFVFVFLHLCLCLCLCLCLYFFKKVEAVEHCLQHSSISMKRNDGEAVEKECCATGYKSQSRAGLPPVLLLLQIRGQIL